MESTEYGLPARHKSANSRRLPRKKAYIEVPNQTTHHLMTRKRLQCQLTGSMGLMTATCDCSWHKNTRVMAHESRKLSLDADDCARVKKTEATRFIGRSSIHLIKHMSCNTNRPQIWLLRKS